MCPSPDSNPRLPELDIMRFNRWTRPAVTTNVIVNVTWHVRMIKVETLLLCSLLFLLASGLLRGRQLNRTREL
jgi:hypothetical protein